MDLLNALGLNGSVRAKTHATKVALPISFHQEHFAFPSGGLSTAASLSGVGLHPRSTIARPRWVAEEFTLAREPYSLVSLPPLPNAYRKSPYYVFCPESSAKVALATCEEFGNRSYVFADKGYRRQLSALSKPDLKRLADTGGPVFEWAYTGEERFRQMVRLALLDEHLTLRLHTPNSRSLEAANGSHPLTQLARRLHCPVGVLEPYLRRFLSEQGRPANGLRSLPRDALPFVEQCWQRVKVARTDQSSLRAMAHTAKVSLPVADRLVSEMLTLKRRQTEVGIARETKSRLPRLHYSPYVVAKLAERVARVPNAKGSRYSSDDLAKYTGLPVQVVRIWTEQALHQGELPDPRHCPLRTLMRGKDGIVRNYYSAHMRDYLCYRQQRREHAMLGRSDDCWSDDVPF